MSHVDADVMSARWAAAVLEGWIDFQRLGREANGIWPSCGLAGCGHRSRYVDPSGIGWCRQHRERGLHEFPGFNAVRFP